MRTSVTAGALVGHFGDQVRRFALRLVQEELVHNVASDAHDHLRRRAEHRRGARAGRLAPLADWLTQTVPAAILSGAELESRPRR